MLDLKEAIASCNIIFFIHSLSHPSLGRVAGAAAQGELEIPHGQQQSQIYRLASHQDGPSTVGDVFIPPGPWCSQQDLPRQSFLGRSGHIAESTLLWFRRSG